MLESEFGMYFAQPSFFEWCVYTFCTLSVRAFHVKNLDDMGSLENVKFSNLFPSRTKKLLHCILKLLKVSLWDPRCQKYAFESCFIAIIATLAFSGPQADNFEKQKITCEKIQ